MSQKERGDYLGESDKQNNEQHAFKQEKEGGGMQNCFSIATNED